jgi:hypothetical protein
LSAAKLSHDWAVAAAELAVNATGIAAGEAASVPVTTRRVVHAGFIALSPYSNKTSM